MKDLIKALLPYGLVERIKMGKRPFTPAAFKKEFFEHASSLADDRFECDWADRWPCLDDRTDHTDFDAHYLYHPAWAMRILAQDKPRLHFDIASSLQFVAMLSAIMPVQAYDYRPAKITLSDLMCLRADLLALPFQTGSISSLSCMHVVEHVGLGRYGDPIDPKGDLKSFAELSRVVGPRGRLLFVVPIAEFPRIQYNAHRIYSVSMILEAFREFELEDLSVVLDSGEFIERASERDVVAQRYACGCFAFRRRNA